MRKPSRSICVEHVRQRALDVAVDGGQLVRGQPFLLPEAQGPQRGRGAGRVPGDAGALAEGPRVEGGALRVEHVGGEQCVEGVLAGRGQQLAQRLDVVERLGRGAGNERARRVERFRFAHAGVDQIAAQGHAQARRIRGGGKFRSNVYAGAFRRLGQFPQARAERVGVLRRFHAGGALRLRLGGGRGRGGGFLLCRARQAAGGLVHAQFAQAGKAAAQPVQAPMLQIERHGRVAADGGQRSAQAREVGVFQKAFAQTALFAPVRAGERAFEVAVLGDEAQGGLFAHAGHAGDVVRSIAHQPLDVDKLRGGNAVSLFYPRGGDALRFRNATLGI